MAVQVHKHPECRVYKTDPLSSGNYINIIISVLTFVIPLIIAIKSQGLWVVERHVREQPSLTLNPDSYILILHSNSSYGDYRMFSSGFAGNILNNQKVFVPIVEFSEIDENNDNVADVISMDFKATLPDDVQVIGVTLLSFFHVKLSAVMPIEDNVKVIIEKISCQPGNKLHIVSGINFGQRSVFPSRPRISHPVQNNQMPSDLNGITFQDFVDQALSTGNITMKFDRNNIVWSPGRAKNEPFTIKIKFLIEESLFYYQTSFLYLLKWAWVQYGALLVISWKIFGSFKHFIFTNQLLRVRTEKEKY